MTRVYAYTVYMHLTQSEMMSKSSLFIIVAHWKLLVIV